MPGYRVMTVREYPYPYLEFCKGDRVAYLFALHSYLFPIYISSD